MADVYWTILSTITGEVLYDAFATKGEHPRFAGWAWDAATQRATQIPARPDRTVQVWSGTAWVDDAAKVEVVLVAKVKAEAELLKMTRMSPGGAKKTEYSEKAGEVRLFNSLAGTVNAVVAAIGLMPQERVAILFPHATADAAAFGDTLQAAIARFTGGMTRAAQVPQINAREARLCADIRAATTAAAKRAKFAARTWPS